MPVLPRRSDSKTRLAINASRRLLASSAETITASRESLSETSRVIQLARAAIARSVAVVRRGVGVAPNRHAESP
jgi:hypothetical protein